MRGVFETATKAFSLVKITLQTNPTELLSKNPGVATNVDASTAPMATFLKHESEQDENVSPLIIDTQGSRHCWTVRNFVVHKEGIEIMFMNDSAQLGNRHDDFSSHFARFGVLSHASLA
ncbi:hypothetical protein E6O75_ATG07805 [Venturia nashicola]|uniref:Uncharacterized protein n=1 Tax=Venturia nashicola TaxID=86259 RepID=A0A4Z1NQY1_9PEZI|nr:hypothetical protein E6O75_ATG07805 [Venturia nashicola]